MTSFAESGRPPPDDPKPWYPDRVSCTCCGFVGRRCHRPCVRHGADYCRRCDTGKGAIPCPREAAGDACTNPDRQAPELAL
ncbi:MAG: hypothetical protein OXC10_20945 [Rhodospirillaceae bacterium]|nr:hypothetical protein [Rhodospirillaceae bacterium]